MAGGIVRGDIRFYQFAQPDKKRPVLIITRDSSIHVLANVTVVPITSTIRGVPSEVLLSEEDGMKNPCAVNLHNAFTVPQSRLGRRITQLNPSRMHEVCMALSYCFGCDFS